MKAFTINEYQSFKRGLDPKEAMNIGQNAMDKQLINETDWELPLDVIFNNFTIIKVIHNYKNYPILVLKSKSDGDGDGKRYIAVTTDNRTDYFKSSLDALTYIETSIDMRVKRIQNKLKL